MTVPIFAAVSPGERRNERSWMGWELRSAQCNTRRVDEK